MSLTAVERPDRRNIWVPSVTPLVNLDAATWKGGFYSSIGRTVICAGTIDIDATNQGQTELTLSLPRRAARIFANAGDLIGVTTPIGGLGFAGVALAEPGSAEAVRLKAYAPSTTAQPHSIVLAYQAE